VAKLHGSALILSDREPGLRVVMQVPLTEAPAAAEGPASAQDTRVPAQQPV
jgi:hypothetical protein